MSYPESRIAPLEQRMEALWRLVGDLQVQIRAANQRAQAIAGGYQMIPPSSSGSYIAVVPNTGLSECVWSGSPPTPGTPTVSDAVIYQFAQGAFTNLGHALVYNAEPVGLQGGTPLPVVPDGRGNYLYVVDPSTGVGTPYVAYSASGIPAASSQCDGAGAPGSLSTAVFSITSAGYTLVNSAANVLNVSTTAVPGNVSRPCFLLSGTTFVLADVS